MTIQANKLSVSAVTAHAKQQELVCNLDYLHRMSGGDNRFVEEMIKLFLKQVPLELEKLKALAVTEDILTAKQIAHKLKSSASMVGAESMVTLLKAFETSEAGGAVNTAIRSFHSALLQLFIHIERELEPLL